MPDLGAPVGAMMDLVGPLVGRALKAFLATTLGMIVLTLLCMAAAVAIAASAGWAAVLAALLWVATLGTVAGCLLAVKRAVASALAQGLRQLALGRRAMALVFSRLLEVDSALAKGERGVSAARHAERIPLDRAEQRLRTVVRSLLGERARKSGLRAWLARKMEAAALDRVEAITLSRFRQDASQHGGVDLISVRDELADRIDEMAGEAVAGMATKVTILGVGSVALLSLAGAYVFKTWLGP